LAILVTTVELLVTFRSRRRQGMHPGALVAFHLFIGLLTAVAIIVTALYVNDPYYIGEYEYPRENRQELADQSLAFEKVLLGFNCVLLILHFVLFVGACAETHHVNHARKKVVLVRVPVAVVPSGAPNTPGA